MSLTSVSFGSRAVSEQVNQIIRALLGTPGNSAAFAFTQLDSSTDYALTLQNQNASDRTLQVLNSDDSVEIEVNQYGTWFPNNVAIGTSIETSDPKDLLVTRSTDQQNYQMVSMEFGTHYGSTGGDVSCLRLIADVEDGATGTTQQRAGEFHTRLYASGGVLTGHSGIDVTLQSTATSTGTIYNNGITVKNLGTTWAISGPQRMDNGVLVGPDEQGWQYGFRYIGTAGAGSPELWRVDQNGIEESRGTRPVATTTYDVGASGQRWNDVFAVRGLWGAGAVGTPTFTFNGDTDTGIFQGTDSCIDFTNSNNHGIRFDANGLIDFKRTATQFVALGAGGAATLGLTGGSGPATTTQNEWLKIRRNSAADRFIPLWV